MKVDSVFSVPTGEIVVASTERGKLEFLSLGDYGQHINLNQHKRVDHQDLLPLSEKWVITISTQYGCSMGCRFCDVPKVGPGVNVSFADMVAEVKQAMAIHPEVRCSDRLNVHFARMGEPTWNPDVIHVGAALKMLEPRYIVHPVVSTMMPAKNRHLHEFLRNWMYVKNHVYEGNAGLQLSINSTSDAERHDMFAGNTMLLADVSAMMRRIQKPKGRKITLNFAVANYTINAKWLAELFSPEQYIVKLTPMHKTTTALQNGIETVGDYTESYPYEHYEEALKSAGFDVLVFIASREEDLGRITCGNAILSGTRPLVEYKETRNQ